jgi:hypothetical protein
MNETDARVVSRVGPYRCLGREQSVAIIAQSHFLIMFINPLKPNGNCMSHLLQQWVIIFMGFV